jgi:ATP-dependent protease HslVU (ClpYQ) peptidase subunit
MTTIAWDGKTLAGDRKVTTGSGIHDCNTTKIVKRKDGALCGTGGTTALCYAFQKWFLKGGKGKLPTLKEGQDELNAIIISPDGKLTIYDPAGFFEAYAPFYAIGTGYELALGAMAMGAKADVAVRIASQFDSKTGTEVDTLELGK